MKSQSSVKLCTSDGPREQSAPPKPPVQLQLAVHLKSLSIQEGTGIRPKSACKQAP